MPLIPIVARVLCNKKGLKSFLISFCKFYSFLQRSIGEQRKVGNGRRKSFCVVITAIGY